MLGPLQLDPGAVGHLVGAGFGNQLVADLGDRIESVGKALETTMRSEMAGSGSPGPHILQGLDVFTEGLDQGQPVAGQEAILGPADVGRQAQGLFEGDDHSFFGSSHILSNGIFTVPKGSRQVRV